WSACRLTAGKILNRKTNLEREHSPAHGFAERDLWNIDSGSASLRLDAGEFDHLAPLLGFLGDELAELGRRAEKRPAAQVGKPIVHLWVGEGRIDLFVEFVDDLRGRIPRRTETPHRARFVVRDELPHGRYVRQRLGARGCGDRQGTQRAGPDVPN